MKNLSLLFSGLTILCLSCNNSSTSKVKDTDSTPGNTAAKTEAPAPDKNAKVADAATIMARKQVPVLCYHHIRPIQMASKASSGYEVTVQEFKDQMKILSDSGYHSILPEQYYNYLAFGTPLPEKPMMLTYDDTDEEQFTVAKAEMDKYGFKGVYFIMSISIGRPRYMNKEQIKQLADEGHVIACHTWDHHRTDRYTSPDWDIQLDAPKKKLEAMTGKPIEYFAYPFGIWSPTGIPEIRKRGYKLAFQLSTKRDSLEPLYTVRRMIVSPEWSAAGVLRVMRTNFK